MSNFDCSHTVLGFGLESYGDESFDSRSSLDEVLER